MCLQKEKEKTVKLDLLVTEMEEQVGQVSQDLASTQDLHESTLKELKQEREAKQVVC